MELTAEQKSLLGQIAENTEAEIAKGGAVNIRANGGKLYRHNTENVTIESKTDRDGIDIFIKEGAEFESVHIPVVLTESGFTDTVYNDFYVGDGATCLIVAGCGINNCGCEDSQHDGIHAFHVGKNCNVTYAEKHYGEGTGTGKRILNPVTEIYLGEGSKMTLELSQIGGVDDTKRISKCYLGKDAELIVQEKLMTHGNQEAITEMDVVLQGENARTRVISRSVAKDNSHQVFYPRVQGDQACFGHVQCDSIIMGNARVQSIPAITCNHVDASLMHEAAIGKIAGDQLIKLQTLGLTAEEAEERILEGFLK